LDRLLRTPNLRQAYSKHFERVRPIFTWEKVCEPIARFCETPHFAADRQAGTGVSGDWTLPLHGQRELEIQQAEIVRLSALVRGYEQGRFMRLMQHVGRWRAKLGS
jgi:hypothetical protein